MELNSPCDFTIVAYFISNKILGLLIEQCAPSCKCCTQAKVSFDHILVLLGLHFSTFWDHILVLLGSHFSTFGMQITVCFWDRILVLLGSHFSTFGMQITVSWDRGS